MWPRPRVSWSILRFHPIVRISGVHVGLTIAAEGGASSAPIAKTVTKGDTGDDSRALGEESGKRARHYGKIDSEARRLAADHPHVHRDSAAGDGRRRNAHHGRRGERVAEARGDRAEG